MTPGALENLQLLLMIGCQHMFRMAGCLKLDAVNGASFSPNRKAVFRCTIDPYSGSQTWFVDSTSVSDCGYFICAPNASNPPRYEFNSNTSTGVFLFTIDPIKHEDDRNVIRCWDGSKSEDIQISVKASEENGQDNEKTILVVVVLCVVIALFILIMMILIHKCFFKNQRLCYQSFLNGSPQEDTINCEQIADSTNPKVKKVTGKQCKFEKHTQIEGNEVTENVCLCFRKKKYITTSVSTLAAQPDMPIIESIEGGVTEINLKWNKPICAGDPELTYLITCQSEKIDSRRDIVTFNMCCTINDLIPDNSYDVNVYAINNEQKSLPATKNIKTLTVTPTVESTTLSDDRCDITWSIPTFPGSDHLEYKLDYCSESEDKWTEIKDSLHQTSFKFSSLKAESVYHVRVFAVYESTKLHPPGKLQFRTKKKTLGYLR